MCPCPFERVPQHGAQGVLILDEQNRGVDGFGGTCTGVTATVVSVLTQPAGRHVGSPGFVFGVGDALGRFLDFLLQPLQLRQRLLTVALHPAALYRIVGIHEVRVERVDTALHRIGQRLRSFELLARLQ